MRRLALLFACLSLPFTLLYADHVYVSGNVSGTWSADTVFVTAEIRVPPGETLVIEPGVKVLFEGHYKLIVDSLATLRAIGLPTDSIFFTAVDTSLGWYGIRFFSASSETELAYCCISYGRANGLSMDGNGGGVFCYNTDLTIENTKIHHCSANDLGGGVYCRGEAMLTIDRCSINNNSASGHGGGIYCDFTKCKIVNNLINNNNAGNNEGAGGGILCEGAIALIENNHIIANKAGSLGGGIYMIYCEKTKILNNIVKSNEAHQNNTHGGGIMCYNSDCEIIGNLISLNTTDNIWGKGGGIYCASDSYYDYHVQIINNILYCNYGKWGGGLYMVSYHGSRIISNLLCNNSVVSDGGGLKLSSTDSLLISNNIICRNGGENYGGGIFMSGTVNTLSFVSNHIAYNTTSGQGGGIYCVNNCYPLLRLNCLYKNIANEGSAISTFDITTPVLVNNTIYNNVATSGYGIYAIWYGNPLITNCVYGESGAIYPTTISINYSAIQSGWPGTGNINLYPSFVDTSLDDYRLNWGSPCIDSGDPDPQYNDPDGTRADMGAFYFDQSVPVRVLLSPHEIPYLIPETGGRMDYTIRANNWDSLAHSASIWCDVTLPDSTIYGPVLGSVTVTISAGQTLARVRTQNVPAWAPMGVYHYNAYAVVGSDTSKDSFMWGKLGSSNNGPRDWSNFGEDFTIALAQNQSIHNSSLIIHNYFISPNPFNPSTVISFELRVPSLVKLEVFDVNGRVVGARHAVPASGSGTTPTMYEAGAHQIPFDGSNLPSGIYFAKLTAGEQTTIQKLVLLK